VSFLTSSDLAPGLMPTDTLTRMAGPTGTVDDIVASASQDAWDEMWPYLRTRYSKPTTCPDGECKRLLKVITRYYLYGRWPETDSQQDADTSPNIVKASYHSAIALLIDIRNADADVEGLDELVVQDGDSGGGYYTANVPVFTKATFRGF